MIFQHTWQQVLDGSKTQTRRILKPNYITDRDLALDALEWPDLKGRVVVPNKINAIFTASPSETLRAKWVVGRTYAVQPGRGQKAVGRIRITGIRQECVQDINPEDAIAEGIRHDTCFCFICNGSGEICGDHASGWGCDPCFACDGTGWKRSPIQRYEKLWDSINTKPGARWQDNPQVWVIDFELVEAQS